MEVEMENGKQNWASNPTEAEAAALYVRVYRTAATAKE